MKKNISKLFSLALALIMALALAVPAFAAQTIEVNMEGGTGSITITNATIEGEYAIYKVFDATYTGENSASYTIKANSKWYNTIAAKNDFFILTPSASDSSVYVVSLVENVSGEMARDYLAGIVQNGTNIQPDAATPVGGATDEDVVFSGITYGYYLVDSSVGTGTVTVTNAKPDAIVIDKNQTPGWNDEDDKLVATVQNPSEDDYETSASVNLGDTVTFQVTLSNAFNYSGANHVYQYTFTDNMGNGAFELVPDSFTVTVNGTTLTKVDDKETAESGNYYDGEGTTGIDIVIPWYKDTDSDNEVDADEFYYEYPDGADRSKIVVTYQATLKRIDANGDAKNKAVFGYNDTKFTEKDGDVYTYQIDVDKVDGDTDDPLMGAKFTLYKTRTPVEGQEGKYTYSDPVSFTLSTTGSAADGYIGTYTYAKSGGTSEISSSVLVSEGGSQEEVYQHIVLKGLAAGEYYLVETKAPAGYNLLTSDPTVVLGPTAENASGNQDYDIDNFTGTQLPSTGGIGTTIFYTLGGLLAVGAVVLLVTKKRMSNAEG